jgi:hypothetical protein
MAVSFCFSFNLHAFDMGTVSNKGQLASWCITYNDPVLSSLC